MSSLLDNDEIDYDKLIEYQLTCLNDEESDHEEKPFLDNEIADEDSYDTVLDKIAKAHEEFYQSCFHNASFDDDDKESGDNLNDSFDSRTLKMLKSKNISYEDFVMTLPKVNSEMESADPSTSMDLMQIIKDDDCDNPTQAWINHEKILRQINDEKWNQYDSFFNKFNERCQSARSTSQKQLEDQLVEEKRRRETIQNSMEAELKLLDERWSIEEADNKLKMLEIESEIEEEKKFMIKLENDAKEVIDYKHTPAAIMIQKVFRRYRIRKRIGAEIDEIRRRVRQKLFNKKLIMAEKETQRKRAIELRKWKKDRDKVNKKEKVEKSELQVADGTYEDMGSEEEQVRLEGDISQQENNSAFYCGEITHCKDEDPLLYEESTNIGPEYESVLSTRSMVDRGSTPKDTYISSMDPMKDIALSEESNIECVEKSSPFTENENERSSLDKTFVESDCFGLESSSSVLQNESIEPLQEPEVNDRDTSSITPEVLEMTACENSDFGNEISNVCFLTSREDEREEVESSKGVGRTVEDYGQGILVENNHTIITEDHDGEDTSKVVEERPPLEVTQETPVEVSPGIPDQVENVNLGLGSKSPIRDGNTNDGEIFGRESSGMDDLHTAKEGCNFIGSNNEEENNDESTESVKGSLSKNVLSHAKERFECDDDDQNDSKENVNDNHFMVKEVVSNTKSSEGNKGLHSTQEVHLASEVINSRENTEDKIDEAFIHDVFYGSPGIVSVVGRWMKDKIREKLASHNKSDQDLKREVSTHLPNIPKHLRLDSNLTKILLTSDSQSIIFSPDDGEMHSCKSLVIKDNDLLSVKGLKDTFSSLQHLVVNNTPLNSIHSDDLLESIIYLNLNRNKLEWAYFGSDRVNNLTSISCNSNDLSEMPRGAFRRCEMLSYLDLSNNNFLTVDSIFKGSEPLMNLCYLNISGNVLSSMESLPFHCPRLTHLSLSKNHIKSWISGEDYPLLVDCDLSHNSLSKIDRLSNTPMVIKLNLSNNNINSLEEFSQSWMPCLSELFLGSNKLTSLQPLHFPLLQIFNVQKNYLTGSIDVDGIFEDCPLITSIDLSNNTTSSCSLKGKYKDIVIHNQGQNTHIGVHCPVGDFATACYDFVDGIRNKSSIMTGNIGPAVSVETSHRHQYHFYRYVRDAVEDFSEWMWSFLVRKNSNSDECCKRSLIGTFEPQQIKSVIKIQSLWRGYRIRKWFKNILKDITFETEKSFEVPLQSDLPEYDENYFLGEWDSHCPISAHPKEVWIHTNRDQPLNQNTSNNERPPEVNDNSYRKVMSCETSCRSSSVGDGHAVILGKKGMDIMKEWGFEDPNSAKWMLQRAKRLKNKSDKSVKKHSSVSKLAREEHHQVTQTNRHAKTMPEEAHMNTITLAPSFSDGSAKIYAWLENSESIPVSAARHKSFLPIIDNDRAINNKATLSTVRRDSPSSMKLPPINTK